MRRTVTRLASMVALGAMALVSAGSAVAAPPSINSVNFTVYACPASIQSPADLETAGGASEVCAVGGRAGDFGTLPDGWTWRIDPVEYALQASVKVHGTLLTNPEANAGGSCSSSTMTCRAFQAYGWFGVPAGRLTLTETTVPPDYTFGWANVIVDGQAATATTDAVARTVTVRPPRGTQDIYVELINIVP
jgi:hypothetical protein